jgi:hypothetical protein
MSNSFDFWNMPDEVYGAMEDDYIFGMSSEPSTETLYDRQDRHRRKKLGLTDPEQDFDYNYLPEYVNSNKYTHEDIKRFQKSLSESCGETIPTESTRVWWLYAESKHKYKKATQWSGKWLIFCPEKHIDSAWEQVKDATEEGLLGGQSKCSTLKGRKGGPGSDYVICCYTYSWKDEKDVMRVREVLRELGFVKPLPYKTDADTIAGKYACKGEKKISKYWE